ncbi:hypothetical protein I8J29_05730 [Paenibacillus sp. MWE-103]|uniref:Glycosyl hydrolases family 39 N-terminal catalytic domain-containing protein n=1 Tax=Paenibacillus artemisiicola TaxID=1172618 RepID=A0ABS3W5U2_9BACL|nr:hypothetical protein [Paenibacillus artemisiicola]MBO7743687.1 hypothetical protein [Paenibacillus artemisiicola]
MLTKRFYSMPRSVVRVDAQSPEGPYEWWRHTISHGGINSHPLPERVVQGAKKLKPRLLRTFIQEYFAIYPEHGRFDWTKLDPYMDSLAATGAKVVAAVTIKPKPLYPAVNQYEVMPNDIAEWQQVIRALVNRYSVEKQIVTYWEIGNEGDIGEDGGCPYFFRNPDDYNEYYRFTSEAILDAFPEAVIGGPALANPDHAMMKSFIDYCAAGNAPLDFISWHVYNRDPQVHRAYTNKFRGYLEQSGIVPLPEMLVTEYSTSFDTVHVEELAYAPERASMIAAGIMAMMDAGLDYSFYYHVWDQVNYVHEFEPFYEHVNKIMTRHWNETPHRFGMFGVHTEVRPHYFVYQMLSRMGDEKLAASSDRDDLLIHAVRSQGRIAALLVNYGIESAEDRIVKLAFANLAPGRRMIRVYRIDEKRSWSAESLELLPVEQREVDTAAAFFCEVYSPAYSVTMFTFEDL